MEMFKQHQTTKNKNKTMEKQQKQTTDCCLNISVNSVTAPAKQQLCASMQDCSLVPCQSLRGENEQLCKWLLLSGLC
jgi:hypothetical protein